MPFIDRHTEYFVTNTDSAWITRPSLHEMRLKDALHVAYNLAQSRQRQTALVPSIVISAIADLIPSSDSSNSSLASLLFGNSEVDYKRMVRHFRNSNRPVKITTVSVYLQKLLQSKKIEPADAARLWYATLIYIAGLETILDIFRNKSFLLPLAFEDSLDVLLTDACIRFESLLEASLNKSRLAPLKGYPLNEIRKFLDFCAVMQWEESRIKRNPLIAIKQLWSLADEFNRFIFDEHVLN